MNKIDFVKSLQKRTKQLVIDITKLYRTLPKTTDAQVYGKQLLRSSSSVAANYRAACRARSKKEFYAKMCLVVEEADETCFWLEILEETQLLSKKQGSNVYNQANKILAVMSKARSNIY